MLKDFYVDPEISVFRSQSPRYENFRQSMLPDKNIYEPERILPTKNVESQSKFLKKERGRVREDMGKTVDIEDTWLIYTPKNE